MKPGLGHIPNPPWYKPLHVSHLLKNKIGAVVPGKSLKPFQFIESIRDQVDTESCVGQATAAGFELMSRAYNFPVPNVSALFNYWLARLGEHPVVDEGSSPFDCIRNIAKYGMVAETKWGFSKSHINTAPPLDVWQDALEHKVNGVFGTYGTEVDTIKQCIDLGYPVCFAQQIDSAFDNYSGGVLPPITGPTRGGHYCVLVDYTDQGAVMLNSWGTAWGIPYGSFSGGFAILSWERLADSNTSDYLVIDVGPKDLT